MPKETRQTETINKLEREMVQKARQQRVQRKNSKTIRILEEPKTPSCCLYACGCGCLTMAASGVAIAYGAYKLISYVVN